MPPSNPTKELLAGIKTGSPIAMGYIPIAIAFGALAAKAQMTVEESVMMSIFVFAGASQFIAASMILAGAGPGQIVLTTFFVNLRHLIMSMAVHEQFKPFPKAWKIGLSFWITDETFATLTLKSEAEKENITPFFAAGLMGVAYLAWVAGTALGGLGAKIIPPGISAGMTVGLYAMFIGLLVPHVRQSLKIGAVALLSMFLNTVFQTFLEAGWAIVLATVLGAFFGALIIKEDA
ncbi:MAG: Inner membrane protein YgaZ [Chloroflexi bacterium]|nr:Inner membrane protein YgaZ [Chloroflexota bacterium]